MAGKRHNRNVQNQNKPPQQRERKRNRSNNFNNNTRPLKKHKHGKSDSPLFQDAPAIVNDVDGRLFELHKLLSPSSDNSVIMMSLVHKITDLFEKIKKSFSYQEVKLVGPYAKGLLLPQDDMMGILVVVLNEMPTVNKILSLYEVLDNTIKQEVSLGVEITLEDEKILFKQSGFSIVTYVTSNNINIIVNLAENEKQANMEQCKEAWSLFNEMNWFEKNMLGGSIQNPKIALKLLRYFSKNNKLWLQIPERTLEILIYNALCSMAAFPERKGLSKVIRGVFEFISSGALYPGGIVLHDQCKDTTTDIFRDKFNLEFLKQITTESQEIVRNLSLFEEEELKKLFPELPLNIETTISIIKTENENNNPLDNQSDINMIPDTKNDDSTDESLTEQED
jgi:hypothetical protein